MKKKKHAERNQSKLTHISPDKFEAVLFDMDGVVTRTAAVHFAAWKKIFDEFIQAHCENKEPFTQRDYLSYVDGKPREDGVRSFLESRKIELPESSDEDGSGDSISSLALRKDEEFLRLIHTNGVEPYETTVALIRSLRAAGVATALVTASRNGAEILEVTNLGHLFDATVDGIDAEKLHLHGKPQPDVFLEAAKRLGVSARKAVVVEDAEAGVESGRNGHFGLVIGVARQHNRRSLKRHGADIVVTDLSELSVSPVSGIDLRGMALSDMDVTEANWVVSYDDFVSAQEMQRESLCSLGNGKFCTRGALAQSKADGVHYPGTYIAGGYNATKLELDGASFSTEELVNMPNWLPIEFKVEDDDWFELSKVELLKYSQQLNLREGILYRDFTYRDIQGRETKVSEQRFVHMRYSHMAGIELSITPLNWAGQLTVRSALDGNIANSGEQSGKTVHEEKHLRALERSVKDQYLYLKVITTESKLVVAESARTLLTVDGNLVDPERKNIEEEFYVAQVMSLSLETRQSLTVRKTVVLYTSRDKGIYEPGVTSREAIADAPEFAVLARHQIQAWRSLWRQYDLFVETTEEHSKLIPSLLLHLNSFHCLQVASPHTVDLDTGIPPRGWTGEGYQGHVFWDDLFVFPFVNLRMPNISAALLKYRYRRLPAARKIAEAHGASGACFPWQSASDGREQTPAYWWMRSKQEWMHDYTNLEIHVNGAIAYNVWQYFQVTLDEAFMYSYGCEILLEIARFFASFAKYNSKSKRYEILGVIGPDEFHTAYPGAEKPGINNNAYTNLMAVWTLCRALELLEKLPPDHVDYIRTKLNISDEEIQLWDKVSRRMYLPRMKNGLICQFEGYENLEEFPFMEKGKIDRDELKRALMENGGYLNNYKISKQADVLMLTYVFCPEEIQELVERLGYKSYPDSIVTNTMYYIPRTANASTISRVVHAWALSRVARMMPGENVVPFACLSADNCEDPTEQIFYEALGSDYFDVASRGTTSTGIHMGAMAGTVDIVQRCFTGIVTRSDTLWIDPALPRPLMRLSFVLHYRGQSLTFDIDNERLRVTARYSSAKPIRIGYGKRVYLLNAGATRVIKLRHSSTRRS